MKYEIDNNDIVCVLLALDAYRWSMEDEIEREEKGDNYRHVVKKFKAARDEAQALYDRLHREFTGEEA